MTSTRLDRAIAAIDAANAEDPNTLVVDGEVRPKEQAHAELMTEWVLRLDPDADDAQRIAARAHHLRRWAIPRDTYPDGRSGYLRWRADLKKLHAVEVAAILTAVGYDEAVVAKVQRIVRKQGLGSDPAVQTHEDALCLVFLATQFDDLIERLGDDKVVDVVAKTVAKMSASGLAAVSDVALSPAAAAVLGRALATG